MYGCLLSDVSVLVIAKVTVYLTSMSTSCNHAESAHPSRPCVVVCSIWSNDSLRVSPQAQGLSSAGPCTEHLQQWYVIRYEDVIVMFSSYSVTGGGNDVLHIAQC